jgi:sugar-specific transcriptional regulator TrmB
MKTEKSRSIPFVDSTFYMLQKASQELYISHKELEREIEELRAWSIEALAENNKLDRQLDVFCEALREICANDKKKAKELRSIAHHALLDSAIINEEVEP